MICADLVPHRSLNEECERQADIHKWLESEKVGFDKGPQAKQDWYLYHAPRFRRKCWIDHLLGEVFWHEFGPAQFGALMREYSDEAVRNFVVTQIRQGCDNLDIFVLACDEKLPEGSLTPLLTRIDMNQFHI